MAVAAIQGFLFGSPKKILFDESLRDRAVEIFTDSIEMSKALGGNILVVGGPTLRIKEFSSSLAYTRGLFSVFTGLAQDQGQSICLENLSDPSGNLLYSSPNEILALEEIGLGLALDIGNFASNFSYADQISPRFWARVRELVLSAKHVQLNLDLIDAEFIRSLVSNTSDLSYELFLESQSLESLSRSVDLFQEA